MAQAKLMMKKRLALAAVLTLAVVATATLAAFYGASAFEEDTFAAKYRLIQGGTTYEEAVALLGPSVSAYPNTDCGYRTYFWKNQDGVAYIALTWAGSELVAKALGVIGTEVVWESPRPWWRRFLRMTDTP